MKWLLSVFESDGANLSLPPIASNDPILSWVWSYIASIQMGQLRDRVDAANSLVSLARDNDRNKKIIIDEGGVTPLLKLLKEGSSPDAQIAAASALFHIATDRERVRIIIDLLGINVVVSVLGDSPMRVQVCVVRLVSEVAELDPVAQEELGRENVIRPLVSLLAMDTALDDPKVQSVVEVAETYKLGGRRLLDGDTAIGSWLSMKKKLRRMSRNMPRDLLRALPSTLMPPGTLLRRDPLPVANALRILISGCMMMALGGGRLRG